MDTRLSESEIKSLIESLDLVYGGIQYFSKYRFVLATDPLTHTSLALDPARLNPEHIRIYRDACRESFGVR